MSLIDARDAAVTAEIYNSRNYMSLIDVCKVACPLFDLQ